MERVSKNNTIDKSNLSTSHFPKIDQKVFSTSLFLTAKSSFSRVKKPSIEKKIVENKQKTLFSWKNFIPSTNSRFLDDKVLTDKLFLAVEPAKKITLGLHTKLEGVKNKNFLKEKIKTRSKRLTMKDDNEFTLINDTIDEGYLTNILNFPLEKNSGAIHLQESFFFTIK